MAASNFNRVAQMRLVNHVASVDRTQFNLNLGYE